MKYLEDFFKQNFTKKSKNNQIINDGVKFEKFIKKLLICEYPDYKVWERLTKQKIAALSKPNLINRKLCLTKKRYKLPKMLYGTKPTHDGGKDFVLLNGDKSIWVECKNYTSNLSLSNISNTLVFAHIKDLKEILIFSLSKLNTNALNTISLFFKHDGKTVRIYDDEALENLIIFHYDELQEDSDYTLPDKKSLCLNESNYVNTNIYSLNIFRDNVNHSMNLIPQAIREIDVNDILGIDILIKNSSSKQTNYSARIDFDTFNIAAFLEEKPDKHFSYDYKIRSCEQKIFGYFFKFIGLENFEGDFNLPKISIFETDTDRLIETFSFKPIKIKHSENITLVGDERLSLKNKINKEIKNDTFKGALFYGQSGTGKTRMLQEILPSFAVKNIRVVYFNIKEWSDDSITYTTIFKKLICKLLNIPLYTNATFFKDHIGRLNDNYEAVITLLEEPLDMKNPDKFNMFYNLLMKLNPESKICLAIDNIQFLSSEINDFLYNLALRNKIDNGKLILTWIINDDYGVAGGSQDEEKIKLIFQDNYYEKHEIKDLETKKSIFIREVLKCNQNVDTAEVDNLLKEYRANPYIIKTVLEWLKSNGYIYIKDNKFVVKACATQNFSSMVAFSDSAENSDNHLAPFKNLWKFYVKMNPGIEKQAMLIIAAIHFLGKLQQTDLKCLNLSDEVADKLSELHFLKMDSAKKIYLFDHDMVEYFFTTTIGAEKSLTEIFIGHLDGGYSDIISRYSPFCKRYQLIYGFLKNSDKTSDFMTEEDLTNLSNIPCNIEKEYLRLHSEFLLCRLKMQADKIEILSYFRSVAGVYRESLGSAFLIDLYNQIYSVCEDNYDVLIKNEVFGWFTIEYCNILSDSGHLKLAETKMEKIVVSKFYSNANLTAEFMFLKAYFLNRLALYIMKQTGLPLSDKKIKNYYNRSLRIGKILEQFGDNRSTEIKYINYTDIGYLYYFDKVLAQKALKMFDKTNKLYEETNLWQKTMNNFHGKIMSELIQGNCENAIKIAEDGINYCYVGEFHYYDGFFMEHFLILQATAYLMRKSEKDVEKCLDNLERIKSIDRIIDINFLSLVSQAEGVCAYYKGDNNLALEKFLDAYVLTKNKKIRINLNPRLKQLKFNIIKVCALTYGGELSTKVSNYNEQYGGLEDVRDVIYSPILISQYKNKIPEGIFTDKEGNFNLPFI